MKAVVYQGIRDVAVQKVADPAIERDDDIIKLKGCIKVVLKP